MPEQLKGLWRQRLRWAQGGLEVLRRYWKALFKWRARRMWLVSFELLVSTFWAYVMGTILVLWLAGKVFALPDTMQVMFSPIFWTSASRACSSSLSASPWMAAMNRNWDATTTG